MNKIKYYDLVKLFENQRGYQCFLLLISMVQISMELYFAYQIQLIVDSIVLGTPYEEIFRQFFSICLIGILTFFISIIQNRQWHTFRYKVINQMREMMFEKIMYKNSNFFDKHTTGDIVAAVMSDGSSIAETAGISVLMLLLNIYKIAIILIVLIHKNIGLGMLILVISALYFCIINRVNKKMRMGYKEFSKETANLNQVLYEDVTAINEIKALNERNYFKKVFHGQIWEKYFSAAKRIVNITVTSGAVNDFMKLIFPMMVLVAGALISYRGYLSIGTLLLFYTYIDKMIEPLNNLADFYRSTQMAVGAADRIHEYMFEPISKPEENSKEWSKETEKVTNLEIDIEEFSWENKGGSLLKNIHQSFECGDIIMIQGESGTGKSTLIKLICGFYKISAGDIKINGKSVSDMEEEEIFRYIKVQFQEPIILEGTIRENIELGQKYSDEKIYESLKMVHLYDFVKEKGLSYHLNEHAKNLSGGQKQRLALARVLLRKPQILILDEATSAIDEENEKIVVQNLKKYVDDNKCILIVTSHKPLLKEICNKEIKLK